MKTAPIMTINNGTEYGPKKKKIGTDPITSKTVCRIYVIKHLLKIFMATARGFRSQQEKHPNLYNIFKKAKLKFPCLRCPN